jgi:hypothetical protein
MKYLHLVLFLWVNDTGGKFAADVNYNSGKFATGINDADGKFATKASSVTDTDGK